MYILTYKSLGRSARLLANNLSDRCGKRIDVEYNPRSNAPLIRWGNSNGMFNNDTKYNSRDAIKQCGSKVSFSNIAEMNNLNHVNIREGAPESYPVFVRTVIGGSGGDGIVVCENEEQFAPYSKNYWSQFYNFRYELGVHIFDGKVVKAFKKKWNGGGGEPKYPIRNLSKGYRFSLVTTDGKFPRLHSYVKSLYDVFDIGFARIDIGWDDSNKCYRAIEINTAPGLSDNENTLELYTDLLSERIL